MKFTSIRFRQDLKHHPDVMGPRHDLMMVFLEALDLDPPLTLLSDARHLPGEGFPVVQGVRRAAVAAAGEA